MSETAVDTGLVDRELRAESYQRDPTRVRAEIRVFGQGARLWRGFLAFAPVFVLGLLVAPIPPHWPGLGLVGFALYRGVQRFRLREEVAEVSGPCPACRDAVALPVAPRGGLPQTVRCPACGEFTKIVA